MIPKRLLFLFTLFLVCAAPTAAALVWQKHIGPPPRGTYVEPVKAKFQDRVPQAEPLPIARVTTIPYRLDPPVKKAALAELVRAPWPCPDIRKAVGMYGADAVKREAKRRGYTKKQIDEAMACVKQSECGPERYEKNRAAYEAGRPQPC